MMRAINPATGEVIHEYAEHDGGAVDRLLVQAKGAFAVWRGTVMGDRSALMRRVAAVLRGRKGELAELMTREMGKPIVSAEGEVEKCAMNCDFYAQHAAEFLAAEQIGSDADSSYVRYDPLGPVFAIMPWNFPLWQVFRFAAPALMAGNVAVVKHASNVPGTALAIEQVFSQAGFPTGCFTTLLVSSIEVERIIAHPAIAAVTLTGSEPAGIAVATAAGKNLKKAVLELGGSDPFIVLPDANVEVTAKAAAGARCMNSGQSCIAAKRFIIVEPGNGFEHAFRQAMSRLKTGDPMQRDTDVGPLAREDLVDILQDQVNRSVAAGAKLLLGGERLSGRGCYYPPTVLSDVRPGMAVFDEETFGPVAAVIRAASVDHAIELANLSPYGLGASVWTRDTKRAEEIAASIDAGQVFINGIVKSDPRLPFGGIKRSGYGRELSAVGIREFTNMKTVWVRK